MADTQLPSSLFTDSPTGAEDNKPTSLFAEAPVDPNKSDGPLSGKFADWYFSKSNSFASDIGNVMSHIGQGAEQAWGGSVNSLPKAADQWLTKAGIYNDYTKGQNDYFKATNEALIRPIVNSLLPIGAAALGGLVGGFQGVGSVLQEHAKGAEQALGPLAAPYSATLGEAGEIIGSIPERVPDLPTLTATARSEGAIGEGEAGFFNTKPVSEEHMAARQEAAKQAGTKSPAAPEPPQMDIHAVVRQMDPVLFQEVDRLNEIKANAKESIQYGQAQDIADLERQIQVAQSRTMVDEPALVARAQDQITELNKQLDILKSGEYGPTARKAQQLFQDADYKLRDLVPDVSDAYSHAQELMMTPDEIAESPELANPRLQELELKAQTDGLSKSEWNEYNILSKSQEEKVEKAPEVREVVQEKPQDIAELSVTSEGATGLKSLSPEAGTPKVPGVSQALETSAIEKGLAESFNDQPEFTSTTRDYQIKGIAKLLVENPEDAKSIALGNKEAPGDLLPSMIFDAVRRKAEAEGDLDMMQALARSPVAVQTSLAGQTLGMSRGFTGISPTKIIQDILKSREDAAKTAGRDVTKETQNITKQIKNNVAKKLSDEGAWGEFIKSIECDY